MTVYRKRLGSSAHSYACSIQNHLDRRQEDDEEWELISRSVDEEPDVEDPDYILPGTTLTTRQHALLMETKERAQQLARHDTKYQRLLRHLGRLEQAGHNKIIIFTEFQDTQDYLANRLTNRGGKAVTRISGQDARIPGPSREERIRAFRNAEDGILICTETAAESLNLQFCTALVNYDVPWNPMTLEQRIGRIDRIGQERETIDVINLFYADTAEYDAYRIMGNRMKAIEENVGTLPAHHATQRREDHRQRTPHGGEPRGPGERIGGNHGFGDHEPRPAKHRDRGQGASCPEGDDSRPEPGTEHPRTHARRLDISSRRIEPLESNQPPRAAMDRDHRQGIP